ncbi:MAG: rod shape-determining protein MreD [Syntrophaceae bacterium]|nr:rod shape-determining protein MreD [Syntrophaceae bacterium]
MLYYLLVLFLSILLIVLQSTITDVIFSNYFVFEISLVVVIYTGFHLDLVKGTILAFFLGFVFDCIGGSVIGLFTFVYIIVFWCSFFISDLLDTEKTHVIISFSFFCALLKEIILNIFYYLAFGVNLLSNMYYIIFMQSLVISLIAPPFFYLMNRTEIFIDEKKV